MTFCPLIGSAIPVVIKISISPYNTHAHEGVFITNDNTCQ
jgi:hypothetical protein